MPQYVNAILDYIEVKIKQRCFKAIKPFCCNQEQNGKGRK